MISASNTRLGATRTMRDSTRFDRVTWVKGDDDHLSCGKNVLHFGSIHTSLSHVLSPSFRVVCFSQVFLSRR